MIKKKVCSIANLENIFNVTHTALSVVTVDDDGDDVSG
jgi:hypothetical protein